MELRRHLEPTPVPAIVSPNVLHAVHSSTMHNRYSSSCCRVPRAMITEESHLAWLGPFPKLFTPNRELRA